MMPFTLLNAFPVMLPHPTKIRLIQVGCGGTGSFLTPLLCRLIQHLSSQKDFELTLIDPDIIESVNCLRQNFSTNEVGFYKAASLAVKYAASFGISINAIMKPFSSQDFSTSWQWTTVIIGCVDNFEARREIEKCLHSHFRQSNTFWLDCGNAGNGISAGQVLLGNDSEFDPDNALEGNFCVHLPSPALQLPSLIQPLTPSLSTPKATSCTENIQAPFVNYRMAVEAVEMLWELFNYRLLRFATFFDGEAGSARSFYTDANTLQRFKV